MERIIKLVLFVALISGGAVFAETSTAQQAPNIPTPPAIIIPKLTQDQCIKTFNVGFEKLFLLTEIAISSNNYTVEQIQSDGGYIVFSVNRYRFLATVMSFSNSQAILKISPCDGNYAFPSIIIKNIFKNIETNQFKK